MTPAWIIGTILSLFVLVEIGCRLYYEHRFGIPFHSRVVGEYPYKSFVERLDAPLYYRFKKNFHSSKVTVNRFRCRGREPAEDGAKRRIMVIGESTYFGVKLRREEDLWSYQLERILHQHGYLNWEVLSAGNPMYNSFQHRVVWEQDLRAANPDILFVNLGGNDVTQAWMMGSTWQPGAPWPWEFITALERRSPRWAKFLSNFCFYFFLRRNITSRPGFTPRDNTFKWDQCLETVIENLQTIVTDARSRGTNVGFVSHALVNDANPRPEDRKKLDAIQSNWESHSKGNTLYINRLFEIFKKEICPRLEIPYIDMQASFQCHPKRFECYLDIAHWNARGMHVVAETLFRELVRLGWLNVRGKENG